MAGIRTDHFVVKSIRPAADVVPKEVPQELRDKLHNKKVSMESLEKDLGVQVRSSSLYHGGESSVVVVWQGDQYVLDLDPAPVS